VDNILKVSEAASLAMHACTFLAENNGEKASTREIAAVLEASEHHLAKVMQRLAKAGLVSPVRGPKGGFVLGKRPDKIALLDIYSAIEGNFPSSDCLLSRRICKGEKCILGGLLEALNRDVMDYLKNTRLSEIDHVYSRERRRRK
jgi:Rrf2 family protein